MSIGEAQRVSASSDVGKGRRQTHPKTERGYAYIEHNFLMA